MKTINAKFDEAKIPERLTPLARIGYKYHQKSGVFIIKTIEDYYMLIPENFNLNNAAILHDEDELNWYFENYVRDFMATKLINAIMKDLDK